MERGDKTSPKRKIKMCPKCERWPAAPPHSCPYQREINDDYDEEYCICCEQCEGECSADV